MVIAKIIYFVLGIIIFICSYSTIEWKDEDFKPNNIWSKLAIVLCSITAITIWWLPLGILLLLSELYGNNSNNRV